MVPSVAARLAPRRGRPASGAAAVAALALLGAAGCTRPRGATVPARTLAVPTPTILVGACGEPGRDGVVGPAPRLDRADRDLDGDGRPESVVVDRALCTAAGNCYWNVFVPPQGAGCTRYAGTFAAAALEPLAAAGDERLRDVRGYWALGGDRLLLQTYRYLRGGYQVVDVLLCRRAPDDRLDCVDPGR